MLQKLLNHLPHNYSDDPDSNIGKLLNIISIELEKINDTLERTKRWHDIDQAKGKTLDRIGNNVGEFRLGRGDAVFRIAIKTRIIANLSGGEMPTLNEVMSTLFGEHYIGTIELWDNPDYDEQPAAIIIRSSNVPTFISEDEEFVREDITETAERVVAAGIGVDWEIPKYVISPIIKATNEVIWDINQLVSTNNEPQNEVFHEVGILEEQAKSDRLNGHHLLNGETNLDAQRDFCVNKVSVEEAL